VELSHTILGNRLLGKVLGVSTFTVLLCFASLIKVPLFFTPVPVTLQTLVVLLAASFLGARLGLISVGLYLGMGVLGVPLFANAGSGILYLFGPTAGYLFGFLFATWLVAGLLQLINRKNFFLCYAVMMIGLLSIYFTGGMWLAIGYGWDLTRIMYLGVLPFVVGDMIKAFVAALVSQKIK